MSRIVSPELLIPRIHQFTPDELKAVSNHVQSASAPRKDILLLLCVAFHGQTLARQIAPCSWLWTTQPSITRLQALLLCTFLMGSINDPAGNLLCLWTKRHNPIQPSHVSKCIDFLMPFRHRVTVDWFYQTVLYVQINNGLYPWWTIHNHHVQSGPLRARVHLVLLISQRLKTRVPILPRELWLLILGFLPGEATRRAFFCQWWRILS